MNCEGIAVILRAIVPFLVFALSACSAGVVEPSNMASGQPQSSRRSFVPLTQGGGALLYLSQHSGPLLVYDYASGTYIGQVSLPVEGTVQGICSDPSGDVYVPTQSEEPSVQGVVYEFAHSGTTPIATLQGAGLAPNGCSFDAKTGNLAVTNYCYSVGNNCQYGHGDLRVYASAQGSPTVYKNKSFYYYAMCGYDSHGNLFVDGATVSQHFTFAELRKGKKKLKTIALNQSFNGPGGVQWDGSHIAVGDSQGEAIYQFSVHGRVGTRVGSTSLSGANDVTYQFWIQGKTVVVPSFDYYGSSSEIAYYDYPEGGDPAKSFGYSSQLTGVTVSLAPK